jgi:DNA-binding MarR family transcriptional regulator
MGQPTSRQARRLYDVFAELARRYQHRDVSVAAYRELSVSQTHVLEQLDRAGPSTMGEIAAALFKSLSAVTRMVDPLVARGLVERGGDPADRRVCRVAITARGRACIEAIREDLALEYGAVLARVPAAHRESVILAVGAMLELFTERQSAIYAGSSRSIATTGRVVPSARGASKRSRSAKPKAR